MRKFILSVCILMSNSAFAFPIDFVEKINREATCEDNRITVIVGKVVTIPGRVLVVVQKDKSAKQQIFSVERSGLVNRIYSTLPENKNGSIVMMYNRLSKEAHVTYQYEGFKQEFSLKCLGNQN